MEYRYKFNKEQCWYKKVCTLYNTAECDKTCLCYYKMYYLAEHSLLSFNQQRPGILTVYYQDQTAFDRLTKIKQNIEQYVSSGYNLLIHSKNSGNGKTTWMCKLLMTYFDKIFVRTDFVTRGLFVDVPSYLQGLKGEQNDTTNYIQENAKTADLVIWDNIFDKNLTEFEEQQLFYQINNRMNNGKSNFYTVTGDINNIKMSQQLRSRVVVGSENIEFMCPDMRGGVLPL